MKKIITLFLALMLGSILVFAAGPQGVHEPGTGQGLIQNITDSEKVIVQTQAGETVTVQQREQLRAQTSTELRQMIQQREQEMQQEMLKLSAKEQNVYKNQNRVRLAVHSLLAMEELIGGIGPQVREIARNFNNSVQATIRTEERIQTRSVFARFFAGGDAEAAGELEQQVNQNQQRIQQLKQLREQCDCDEQVRAMMQEQIQNMEQEQTRLQQLAQAEKKSKGLLGWLWK